MKTTNTRFLSADCHPKGRSAVFNMQAGSISRISGDEPNYLWDHVVIDDPPMAVRWPDPTLYPTENPFSVPAWSC